ncbi:MAG: sigma-70 family RNA polymerase sigma factor [Anaerolineaceae bacterium]|nr:sigma-70 family RNA polymerase sigma factor [Anaerolineaceae bacterium]
MTSLVQNAMAGNTEAIESLLLQYQPSLTRFARKFCATPDDVEDAVQQTLWIIYRKINGLRTSKAFVSWIFQIVRNECYALLRHGQYGADHIEISKLDYLDYISSTDHDLYSTLAQDLIRAIEQLPIHQREVLILRDIEGLTTPETAETLNITVEAVKSRLHYARTSLRQSLQAWAF